MKSEKSEQEKVEYLLSYKRDEIVSSHYAKPSENFSENNANETVHIDNENIEAK